MVTLLLSVAGAPNVFTRSPAKAVGCSSRHNARSRTCWMVSTCLRSDLENTMRKARIAEWLITHVSTPQRASEVVGDLLEQNPSTTQFWLTIIRILAALTWRWTLGAFLASIFSAVVLASYSLWVIPRRDLAPHFEPWIFWAM